MRTTSASRRLLLDLFAAALRAVDGQLATAAHLRRHPLPGPVHAIAVGKAAPAMLHGALEVLGEGVESALMITKHGYEDAALAALPRVRCLSAGHPVPNVDSFAAGQALIDYVAALPAAAKVLVLLSGGASSLVEAPVGAMTPDDIGRATDYLLSNGWDIGAMNALRKRWSRLKGGGLLGLLGAREVEVLLISDVPDDDPAVIGSGPLWPSAPVALPDLPAWLAARVPPPAVPPDRAVPHRLVARNSDARAAVVTAAEARGVTAEQGAWALDGDVLDAARRVTEFLADASPGVYVWGGETTVRLPENPGRGGRNQQFALAVARAIEGRDDICVLAAGTDGTDGPGQDAGALVDGGTLARGSLAGLAADDCMARADAGSFLAASGDLISTGPTGTNVMDVVIACVGGEACVNA